MAHASETESPLTIANEAPKVAGTWPTVEPGSNDVWFVVSPAIGLSPDQELHAWRSDLVRFVKSLGPEALIGVLTTPLEAAHLMSELPVAASFQLWVAVKLHEAKARNPTQLPEQHAALLIFSRYRRSLRHTKMRIAYTYCPACDKTTKDYGGKKHTYHHYGTLISDVWRDIGWSLHGSLKEIERRLADLFAVDPHRALHVCDMRIDTSEREPCDSPPTKTSPSEVTKKTEASQLLLGDCLQHLRALPADSIDFCFADPPYNIAKKYDSWDDALDLRVYFEWCDAWLDELARVLRPGCTCAVLNIPQFAARHFAHLRTRLQFQNWIVWEGLSLPVRMIMPAHYSIICFSKGEPRPMPGLRESARSALEREAVTTLREFYCVRQSCVQERRGQGDFDREAVTDLWWDIHRLKHNSRRVDHPCQLPPALMHRLIALFTYPGEIVLDPFNGAGTTSLCAAQLNRRYLGIEMSERYHELAGERHALLARGGDPFAKAPRVPKSKNSRVKRIGAIDYVIPKKKLQLEVRDIARRLGRLPTREEVERYSQYPIRYFDEYFISWGEVCAAARTTGMQETRTASTKATNNQRQGAFSFLTDSETSSDHHEPHPQP